MAARRLSAEEALEEIFNDPDSGDEDLEPEGTFY